MQRADVETGSVVNQIVCDRCGKEASRSETEFHEMTSIVFKAGYGSIFGDGNHVEIDLCQHCLNVLIRGSGIRGSGRSSCGYSRSEQGQRRA